MIINIQKICRISELQDCVKDQLFKNGINTKAPWVVFGMVNNSDFIVSLYDSEIIDMFEKVV